MTDLRTRYMGLQLANPVIAAASPLSRTVDGIRRLFDAGVGAVVLYSLFEEQIRREEDEFVRLTTAGTESFGESVSYFPRSVTDDPGPAQHLRLIERAGALGVPVIASLNGSTAGGWIKYAQHLEGAGAAAIELNLFPSSPYSVVDVQRRHVEILGSVKACVQIPIAVKFGPNFDAVTATARHLDAAGADALVLVNRYPQLEVDLETLAIRREMTLSARAESRPVRNWISWLHGRVKADLAASTGVETSDDVARYLLAGANVVMTASALLRHGPEYATELIDGLERWLADKGFATADAVRGMAAESSQREGAGGRAGYFEAMWVANADESASS